MSVAKNKSQSTKRKGNWLGLIPLIFGSLVLILTFLPIFRAEVNYKYNSIVSSKDQPKPTPTPVNTDFSIQIGKININTPVIKNVDPYDSRKYQVALTRGVAHALGSVTPDQLGNVFIFAHSAQDWYQANRFNAIFYLINKLEKGDEITLYYQGKPYLYSVSKVATVDSNAVDYLKADQTVDTLQLMTCWPPGTTLKRMIVTAIKKS